MVFCLLLLWLGLRGSESEKKLVAEEKAQTAPAAGSDKESNIDKDYNQGMAALENGDYHSAISCFTLAIERQSEHVESYHGRASANLALGALDKAIADSTEAIRLKSDHAKAYGCRALAYGKKGDVDKAIADFTTSLRLELDAEKFLGRANAYIMKSEWKKVIEDTTQAIRLRPGYPDAYLMRGFACNKEGDYSQAITDMTEAIRLKPSPDSYYFRAIAHQANGDTAKATSDIEAGQKLQQQLTTERGKNGSLQNSYTKPTSDKEDSPFQPKTPAVQAAAPVRGDNDSSPPDNKDSSTIKIIELIVPFRQA